MNEPLPSIERILLYMYDIIMDYGSLQLFLSLVNILD